MSIRWRSGLLWFVVLLSAQAVRAEDPVPPPPPPKDQPDPKVVHAAIDKGVQYLVNYYTRHPLKSTPQVRELILYALLHGGLKPDHPIFQRDLPDVVNEMPQNTYNVAIAMMLFHRLDPVKYRLQIARGASFLVQNQSTNGQWTYAGQAVPLRDDYEVYERQAPYIVYDSEDSARKGKKDPKRKPEQAPAGEEHERVIAKRLKGFKIPPQKDVKKAPAGGDNSNTQYAILGLRAAAESGCLIPDETWKRTLDYIQKGRNADGGFSYQAPAPPSTHTMTTAGASMLAICDFYLKQDPGKDPALQGMLDWLGKHFDVKASTSIFRGDAAHYYYLYGLERAATLVDSPVLGGHPWYPEGAAWLLSQQKADGSWQHSGQWANEVNIAFAILFLRRSTLPLIPEDKREEYEVGEAAEGNKK